MRIITWNCNRGDIASKLAQLRPLNPDIVFIQEARKPSRELAPSQIWKGDVETQGVAAFGFNGYDVSECPILEGTHPVTLPFFVKGKIELFVLGIWAKKAPKYVKCVWNMLDVYQSYLGKYESVVLGDFNSNVMWNQDNPGCSHSMLVERLERDFNLVSSYHSYTGFEQGSEKHPTIYHMYNKDKPYHIDYCFIPHQWASKLQNITIGEYESYKKLSDHRPLIVDIDITISTPYNKA